VRSCARDRGHRCFTVVNEDGLNSPPKNEYEPTTKDHELVNMFAVSAINPHISKVSY